MLYDIVVTVKVGPAEKEFFVHKGLISHRSEYFRGAFNGNFKEEFEPMVVLKDEDVKVSK
jgi:hypothetical protein